MLQRRGRETPSPPPAHVAVPGDSILESTPVPDESSPEESLGGLVDRRFDSLFAPASDTGGAATAPPDRTPGNGGPEASPPASGTAAEPLGPAVPSAVADAVLGAARIVDPDPVDADALASDPAAGTVGVFAEITRSYIAPVQRFVLQLRRGPYGAAGLEMHRPAMEMVARAAERLPVGELGPKLNRFSAALQAAVDSGDPIVAGIVRARILDAYSALESSLPVAFRIDEGASPADDVILLSLLRQIPDVGTVTLDKLFGAGLTVVDMFAEATPRDLSVTAGISESLATRICVRVQGYLVSRRGAPDAAGRAEHLARLSGLVADLRELHDHYESLRRDDRVRWAHRRRRLDVALQINLALAEMGERGLIDVLQTLPFERRIDRLVRYVESLGGKLPRRTGG